MKGSNKLYQNEETLRKLYHEDGLTQPEIAEKYGIKHNTVSYWMKKHGIEARTNSEAQKKRFLKEPVPLFSHGGYLWALDQTGKRAGRSSEQFPIHRLVYVAHHGFESVKDKCVHHKNGHKCDNRPENLEAMSKAEHSRLHYIKGDTLLNQRESGANAVS